MKRIMVFDVPAESGGALSVLYDFYNEYKADKNNEYIFVISKPELLETENVKVLRYPWIKNSWFHRLFFDHYIAPYLIRKYKVDEVISLQNIIVPHTNVRQTVYVHNSLPFADYRFSIFEDRLLWVYQNILSKCIFKSIKKASKVIVQTKWMKEACVNKLKVGEMRIDVLYPNIDIKIKKKFIKSNVSLSTFFYPASEAVFKNHKIIVEACLKLKKAGVENYKVVFTLEGNENSTLRTLYKTVKEHKLPVYFIGDLSREEVFEYYSKSVLVFPSYIETVGLPLLEAQMHETPIIVSDCNFSREILKGYENAYYFDPFNECELFQKMYDLSSFDVGV